ncbi:MAG TPA: DNA oxidative demethylase AlkB [Methylophilaceae bacterium]|nr:DNA oxidative demethylase AlkB [Methylophilaceae bacterium]
MHNEDLFQAQPQPAAGMVVRLGESAVLLKAYAEQAAPALLEAITHITGIAPWRNMVTPGGYEMSVAMSNCGDYGWVSDRRGYRYAPQDPLTGRHWPTMPQAWLALVKGAAQSAGFSGFVPDACLINRYAVGARMGLHQDRDEADLRHPIVSVSLGLPAVFQFGGNKRAEPVQRVLLEHGDVVVWGGVDRLRFHGIQPLKPGARDDTGSYRYNLTFRKAG